jgi:hypothetical protein
MRGKRHKKLRQTPPEKPAVVGVSSRTREDLRSIAVCQKCVMGCIAAYVIALLTLAVGQYAFPPMLFFLSIWGFLGAFLAAAVFAFLLSTKVYGVAAGILRGLLVLVPFLGLIVLLVISHQLGLRILVPLLGLVVLLVINHKANRILRQNGHRVGILGADLSEF